MTSIRIGQGIDVHRFAAGRKLVLGGVEIPHDKGLDGHSDADALTHAIMDALLGAIGERDIGHHFPNTDPKYRGSDSLELLRHVIQLLGGKKARVVNLDCTVLAEEPKLNPHIPKMKTRLAPILGIPEGAIAIKATTTEQMGFTGKREGVVAQAVVLVELGV